MLLYNTTYHVEQDVVENFLIWLREKYMNEVKEEGSLINPRLCKILSHIEEGSECYCLQWNVESSGILHRWHLTQGMKLNGELMTIFGNKVLGIPTLMEIIE